MRCSWGVGPLAYLRSNRSSPSVRTVAAIFCATVSGDPTYIAPDLTSLWKSASTASPHPRSRPIWLRLTSQCGMASAAALASVSAMKPGEWTAMGSRGAPVPASWALACR